MRFSAGASRNSSRMATPLAFSMLLGGLFCPTAPEISKAVSLYPPRPSPAPISMHTHPDVDDQPSNRHMCDERVPNARSTGPSRGHPVKHFWVQREPRRPHHYKQGLIMSILCAMANLSDSAQPKTSRKIPVMSRFGRIWGASGGLHKRGVIFLLRRINGCREPLTARP